MACFALGTMPLLWMAAGGIRLSLLRQGSLRRVAGFLILLTGLLGLLNGLVGARVWAWICA